MTDHATQRVHYEAQAAIAEYPLVLSLLAEARAALGPEFCGYAGSLAGRIDDALHIPVPLNQPLANPADLVIESYDGGDSFGWFRK